MHVLLTQNAERSLVRSGSWRKRATETGRDGSGGRSAGSGALHDGRFVVIQLGHEAGGGLAVRAARLGPHGRRLGQGDAALHRATRGRRRREADGRRAVGTGAQRAVLVRLCLKFEP